MAQKRFNIYTPDYIRVWLKVAPSEDLAFVEDESPFDVGERPDWLDEEIGNCGWSDFLGADWVGHWPDANLHWLLTEGIAPGQPFLVEMSRPHYTKSGGYYEPEEWDVEYDANVMQIDKWPAARTLKAWTRAVRWYYPETKELKP